MSLNELRDAWRANDWGDAQLVQGHAFVPSLSFALKWAGIGVAHVTRGEPSRGVPQVLERPMEARSAGRAGSTCFTVSRRVPT